MTTLSDSSGIQFQDALFEEKTLPFHLIHFDIPTGVITPNALAGLKPPPTRPATGVILSGRGPVWLYGFLVHHYHPAPWVALCDPRLAGAVVVESHVTKVHIGDVIPMDEKALGFPES